MTESFDCSTSGESTTGFTVVVTLYNATSVRIFSIIYMAVDRSFPYHLNMFTNIPANYLNGLLTNVSSSSISTRIYTNTVNYTTLANSYG